MIAYATQGVAPERANGEALRLLALAGLVAALAAAPLLLLTPDERGAHPERRPEIRAGFRSAFRCHGFPTLVGAFLLNGVGNAIPAVLFILYVGETLESPAAAGPLLLLYFLCGVLSIPLWVRYAHGRLKERVWIASLVIACAGFVIVPFLGPGDVTVFAVICAITGAAFGADMVLPASMNADQARRFEETNATAQTAVFFGVWGTATKLASAIGVGLALPIIGFGGPAGVAGAVDPTLLAFVYGWGPILFKIAAGVAIWRYPREFRSAGAPA